MSSDGRQPAMEVDVAHLMSMLMQFLYENGLYRSLDTLREESGVRWFGSDETADLIKLIERGPTSGILLLPLSSRISSDLYIDIFELILMELLQKKCTDAVKHVLEKGRLIEDMKERCPSRLDKLLRLARGPPETNYWGSVYGSRTEEEVRKRLVQAVKKDLCSSYQLQPSELLMRLGMARSSVPNPAKTTTSHDDALNVDDIPTVSNSLHSISHCFATKSVPGLATTEQITAIACSPNGRYLAIGTLQEVIILNPNTLKPITACLSFHFPGCVSLAFKDNFLAMVNLEGQIFIADIVHSTSDCQKSGHRGGTFQVIFATFGDEDMLISSGADQCIGFWLIEANQEKLSLKLMDWIEVLKPFDVISIPLPNLIITGGDSRECFLVEGKIDKKGCQRWTLAGSISLLGAEKLLVEPKVSQLVSEAGRTYFVLVTGDVGVIDVVAKTSHMIGKVQLKLGINGYCWFG